jgi:uncharacterized protein (TIGR02145 family)
MKVQYFLRILLLTFISTVVISSCKDDDDTKPVPETGTVTDIDGNTYKTVKIGNQWWMAENLKVTRYRTGTPIAQVQDPIQWTTAPDAFCLYENNSTSPGLLYNHHAVANTENIAPEGWRIPTDADWKELERTLGMSDEKIETTGWRGDDEGNRLKLYGEQGWKRYQENWPTNESGFGASAGSCRLFNGYWGNPGLFYTGFWWTATDHSGSEAWYRHMDYKKSNIFRYYGLKSQGYSIRCVKNN